MDPGGKKFGRAGPRELNGGFDLISRYQLLAHHDFFCNRSLPSSILDANYLQNIVGDADIRKGEGMQLDQLVKNYHPSNTNAFIRQFDLGALHDAFRLHETTPIDLPLGERGVPTVASKTRKEPTAKEKKRRKKKDREHGKKHKHHHKDRSTYKDNQKDKTAHCYPSGNHPSKDHEKKRKLDGYGGLDQRHKYRKGMAIRTHQSAPKVQCPF